MPRALLTALLLALTAGSSMLFAFRRRMVSPERRQATDYDHLCVSIRTCYCYFDQKTTDWETAVRHFRPLAVKAGSRLQFIRVLEELLEQLYDPHTHLTVNLADSWRLPAHDIWAEWRDGKAVVTEVRSGSAAVKAGLTPGCEIVRLNGRRIAERAAERQPRFVAASDSAAKQWALLAALAGQRGQARELTVRDRQGRERIFLLQNDVDTTPGDRAVIFHSISPGIGYIRIASFEKEDSVTDFDRALKDLRRSSGLVIDVRDNSGGDTKVSRPIMGRFVRHRVPYAWMNRRQGAALGERWHEYIRPRGKWQYAGPVVILVNHWTASAAEGFAMGLEGVGRATVVGSPMAGLGAGVKRIRLKWSRIGVQISTEPVYHVDGRPRIEFMPNLEVDLTRFDAAPDPILAAGLEVLKRSR